MFVDDKREGEVHTEPSLKGLIAWLETHDPTIKYDWYGCRDCLIASYFRAIGYPRAWEVVPGKPTVYLHEIFGGDTEDERFERYIDVGRGDGKSQQWTYGGALQRARALAKRIESCS